jgi:hypothetical protein
MPVILTTQTEAETWLTPLDDALALQRPLPDGGLKIVARGDRIGDPPGVAFAVNDPAGLFRQAAGQCIANQVNAVTLGATPEKPASMAPASAATRPTAGACGAGQLQRRHRRHSNHRVRPRLVRH